MIENRRMQWDRELATKIMKLYPSYMRSKRLQSRQSHKDQFIDIQTRKTLHFEAGDREI